MSTKPKSKQDNEIYLVKKRFKLIQKTALDIPQHELWLIYEFLDFSQYQTQLVIEHTKRVLIKKLTKDIVSHPKIATNYINQIMADHKEELERMELKEKEILKNKEDEEKERLALEFALKNMKPGEIMKMPEHFIIEFAIFLDPRSLFKLSFTCKNFRQIIIENSNSSIFKKFCRAFYKDTPPLPLHTIFWTIENLVAEQPHNFCPEIRMLIAQDVRKVAWDCAGNSRSVSEIFKTPVKYYKQFNSYYKMFMEAPRVHYGGYYVIKEKYTKIGEKDIHQTFNPLIVVSFYRYFRFFPDGRFIFFQSNKKPNVEEIVRKLSIKIYEAEQGEVDQLFQMGLPYTDKSNHVGEFILQENNLHVKFASHTSIFSYLMKIASTSYGAHDELIVVENDMNVLQIRNTQCLYHSSQEDSSKIFRYKPREELRLDLPQGEIKRMTL